MSNRERRQGISRRELLHGVVGVTGGALFGGSFVDYCLTLQSITNKAAATFPVSYEDWYESQKTMQDQAGEAAAVALQGDKQAAEAIEASDAVQRAEAQYGRYYYQQQANAVYRGQLEREAGTSIPGLLDWRMNRGKAELGIGIGACGLIYNALSRLTKDR